MTCLSTDNLSFRSVQRFVLLFFLCLVSLSAVLSDPNYRLPSNVTPLSYELTIRPYLHQTNDSGKNFTFDGEAFINITSKIESNAIVLHSKDLNYTKIEYWESALPNVKKEVAGYEVDPVTDKLTLQIKNSLALEKTYTFHFVYTASIRDDLKGFYRSSYLDANNEQKWIGVTKFEPVHARTAFPCFDEPKFTSEFQITIIRGKNFKTVSNTRLLSSTQIDSLTYADKFEKTPRMCVSNVAWLVSEFVERSNQEGNFSVIARPEHFALTKYALELGQNLLKEYEQYFSIPYENLGIPKMHLAAISDLRLGGMENWGLITLREKYVFYDQISMTLLDQHYVATRISHELAHMWFGNSLVCEWWSYTWLKEGFANYFQYMITANIYPDWNLEEQFVEKELKRALQSDSYLYEEPLTNIFVSSPSDVKQTFLPFTYQKGSSIIRMFRYAMGEENFKTAIQEYLAEFKGKVVTPDNLLHHLFNNWPRDTQAFAKGVFESFTTQAGYPLITIRVSCDGMSMEISQKRFLAVNHNHDNDERRTLLYTVPLTYTTSGEINFTSKNPNLFLEPSDGVTKIQFESPVDWVLANVQQTGYYRVNYNEENWNKICKALSQENWGGIHVVNRAQIIDDLFELARLHRINFNLTLKCLDYLSTEHHSLPWSAAFEVYDFIHVRLGVNTAFPNYILHQIDRIYNHLGFDERQSDSRLDIYNRPNVLRYACKYGNQDCILKSLRLFESIQTKPVPVDIRFPVYCGAIMGGTENHLNQLLQRCKNTTDESERSDIIHGLGCVKNETLVENYFNVIIDSDMIAKDEIQTALQYLYSFHSENLFRVYKLIIENHEKLAERLGSYEDLAYLLSNIVQCFTSEEQLQNFKNFTETKAHKFGRSFPILRATENVTKNKLIENSEIVSSIIRYLNDSNTTN